SIHGYSPNRYLGSFAGLAPIDHPRLAIIVQIDEPSAGQHYGGLVAGPAFAQIASESLRYLGVPGDPVIVPPAPGAAPVAAKPAPVPPAIANAGTVDSATADD